MKHTVLLAAVVTLAFTGPSAAQDGLRSASLPERPVATQPPGPGDLYRATPNTYRPHATPVPPLNGRGSGGPHPEHPIAGGGRGAGGGSGYWLNPGWAYLPYYSEPGLASANGPAEARVEGGRLQLRVAPGDALVFIDGGFEGSGDSLREPGALLRSGSHRVRLEAPGFATHTFDIRIDDGETVTQRVTLGRERAKAVEAQASAVAQEPKTLYIIPRCYAGDKPPSADTHCDLTQLRTIR